MLTTGRSDGSTVLLSLAVFSCREKTAADACAARNTGLQLCLSSIVKRPAVHSSLLICMPVVYVQLLRSLSRALQAGALLHPATLHLTNPW